MQKQVPAKGKKRKANTNLVTSEPKNVKQNSLVNADNKNSILDPKNINKNVNKNKNKQKNQNTVNLAPILAQSNLATSTDKNNTKNDTNIKKIDNSGKNKQQNKSKPTPLAEKNVIDAGGIKIENDIKKETDSNAAKKKRRNKRKKIPAQATLLNENGVNDSSDDEEVPDKSIPQKQTQTQKPKKNVLKINNTLPVVHKTENEADVSSDDEAPPANDKKSANLPDAVQKKKKNKRKKKNAATKVEISNGNESSNNQGEKTPQQALKSKKNKQNIANGKNTEESSEDEDSSEKPQTIINQNGKAQSSNASSASSDEEPPKKDGKVKLNNKDVKTAALLKVKHEADKIDMSERYPILKDQKFVESFMNVKITNGQKGRIRQALFKQFKDIPDEQKPDLIHARIQAMIKGTIMNDSQLRRIRILYNMLKETLKKLGHKTPVVENLSKEKKQKVSKEQEKVKGPKRYVVFVGNLPVGIQKERLTHHFLDISDNIKDIRLPETPEGKKAAIAYIELDNETSYELALSKNHTMLDNRRINVQYSVQKNSKITLTEAKGKSAKLLALQKAGKLIGSVPLEQKRSQRRNKMKKMRAEAEASA